MTPLKVIPRPFRPSSTFLRREFQIPKLRKHGSIAPTPRGTLHSLPPITRIQACRTYSTSPPQSEPQNGPGKKQNPYEAISSSLQNIDPSQNNLLSPVHVPEDSHGLLSETHPATGILANSSIVITRQLELMNVMLGFEQANKYVILDGQGQHIGFMAEKDLGMGNMFRRQMFGTHRSFETHIFDRSGREVLRFHRPFAWISSRIGVYDPVSPDDYTPSSSTEISPITPGTLTTDINQDAVRVSPLPLSEMSIVGEAQQQWAPLRRKYNLFVHRHDHGLLAPQLTSGDLPLSNSTALEPSNPDAPNSGGQFGQFAYVDEPFLSWDFSLLTSDKKLLGSVNRNFAGFGREIFTDTGVYALRMDAASLAQEPRHLISKSGQSAGLAENVGMTLDQRAVMLATAVSVDFDYFSRQSRGSSGGFWPLWMGGGEGGAAAEGAGAEAGAEGGALEGAEGPQIPGKPESAAGAAAGLAGYELYGPGEEEQRRGNDPTPTMDSPNFPDQSREYEQQGGEPPDQWPSQGQQDPPNENTWGQEEEPWAGDQGGGDGGGSFWDNLDLGD